MKDDEGLFTCGLHKHLRTHTHARRRSRREAHPQMQNAGKYKALMQKTTNLKNKQNLS